MTLQDQIYLTNKLTQQVKDKVIKKWVDVSSSPFDVTDILLQYNDNTHQTHKATDLLNQFKVEDRKNNITDILNDN